MRVVLVSSTLTGTWWPIRFSGWLMKTAGACTCPPGIDAIEWRGRLAARAYQYRLGRVLELNSDGKVSQFAVVADATWQYFRDGEITASYTWNDTRDNTSFHGNVANTATLVQLVKDDPRNLGTLTYSDNHFRNKVVFYGTLPSFFGITLGVRYTGIGGTRYSLLSGGNTNADFVRTNDLAYVFDRNSPELPANVRADLQALLDNPDASQSLKDYINTYSGRIAQRNGGINGFFGVVDIRALKRFRIHKTHAIEVSADIFNFANLLNRNRGTNRSLGSQVLYALGVPAATGNAALPGFSQATQQYNYRVNNSGGRYALGRSIPGSAGRPL